MSTGTKKFHKEFAGKLKEVFFYITNSCNLKCKHCYMPEVKKRVDMPFFAFKSLLFELQKVGVSKITLLGGEPTLHPDLLKFIREARNMGLDYIRIDTNGQFPSELLQSKEFKLLDDICFSLDGTDIETHGFVRSKDNYHYAMENLKLAVSYGFVTKVTMTINTLNISQVEKMASMLEKIGVSVLNLHLVSENGRAKINKDLLLDEENWLNLYEQILPKLRKYNIKIKAPKRYARIHNMSLDQEVTCEIAKRSRVSVLPDLKIYACPLLLDKNKFFAEFQNRAIRFTRDYRANFLEIGAVDKAVCPLLLQENYQRYKEKQIIPLCVSYRPEIRGS